MKTKICFSVVVLYGFALLCFFCYMFAVFHPQMEMTPMKRLILLGCLCVFAYFGSLLFSKAMSREKAQKIMRITFMIFFGLYLILLVTLVLFDSYFGRVGFSFVGLWNSENIAHYRQNSFNIIPFKTIFFYLSGLFGRTTLSLGSIVTNFLGNLIAFAPFSFFLPLLSKKYHMFGRFLLTMVVTVVGVEVLQFILLTGCCDIDDVILNVLGACIGHKILWMRSVKKVITKITTIENEPARV